MTVKYSRLIFLTLVLIVSTACAHKKQAQEQILNCPADSIPVFSKEGKALGCTPAARNRISSGNECEDFQNGSKTMDQTGAVYECTDAKPKK